MKTRILILLSLFVCLAAGARVNTVRKNLQGANKCDVAELLPIDTIDVEDSIKFRSKAINVSGYVKRASDWKETFMLTNNTNLHISLVQIRFRYVDVNGNVINDRAVKVPCDLPPYSSRQASCVSWDKGKVYYYYQSGKPRKKATPYRVSFKILRYDVVKE